MRGAIKRGSAAGRSHLTIRALLNENSDSLCVAVFHRFRQRGLISICRLRIDVCAFFQKQAYDLWIAALPRCYQWRHSQEAHFVDISSMIDKNPGSFHLTVLTGTHQRCYRGFAGIAFVGTNPKAQDQRQQACIPGRSA